MTATQTAPEIQLATIRGLTIHQPWAWFIAKGHKAIENRSWNPPRTMVGQWLAIHVGKKFDPAVVRLDFGACKPMLPPGPAVTLAEMQAQLSHIIAVARLVGTVTRADLALMAKRDRPWFFGPIGWVLDSVVAIPPVPCKGAQGLWNPPPDVLAMVRERYAAAEVSP